MRIERELMRGAGPVSLLKLLESGPKYGYELVTSLAEQGEGILDMGQSTLYPMLYNLEAQGFIKAAWEEAETGRNRKYYSLTPQGKKRLAHSVEQWRALAKAFHGLGILEDGSPSRPALGGATP